MKLKIAVAFGGRSVEHEISVLSAQQVMAALDEERYEILPLYIAKDGRMFCEEELRELETFQHIEEFIADHTSVALIRREAHTYLIPSRRKIFCRDREVDMVFPVLHGTNGEDGTFQGYLKTIGVPYVGCSVLAGAIGQDKVIMKQVLQDSGLSVVPWFFWTLHQPMEQSFFKKAQRLGYPLIIKPANLGSSVGIAVAHNDVELHKSMIEAFQYDHKVVIEKVIEPLREINASVLGDEDGCRCSTLEEVVKQDEILSYDDKYSGQGKSKGMLSTSRKLPAELSDEQAEEIRSMAMDTFRALNAAGVVRIDFLMHADSSALYVNEINTIPGSLSFYLWEKEGLPFPALLDELISLALQRVRREQKMIFSYDTNILRDYKGSGKLMK